MGLATPFFRHLARPREAENKEREKVMMNSMKPPYSLLIKVPSPKMMFSRLSSDPHPVKYYQVNTKLCNKNVLTGFNPDVNYNESCRPRL